MAGGDRSRGIDEGSAALEDSVCLHIQSKWKLGIFGLGLQEGEERGHTSFKSVTILPLMTALTMEALRRQERKNGMVGFCGCDLKQNKARRLRLEESQG